MLDQPQSVSLHTTSRQLYGQYLVHYEDGRSAVVDVQRGRATVYVNRLHNPRTYDFRYRRAELGDIAISARRARPESAFKLPPGEVVPRWSRAYFASVVLGGLLTGSLTSWGMVSQGEEFSIIAFLLFGLFGALLALGMVPQANHLYEMEGAVVPIDELVSDDHDRLAGVAIVDAVKEEYGALLTDVVYRIENSALLDPASERTRVFTETLARWDHDRSRMRPDQRHRLAAEVRVAFDAARAHAERVGLRHLPVEARSKARQAAQALALARDAASTKAEREAATRKANELLSSLMLYYLPKPKELSQLLGGKAPKALPGRRHEDVDA